MNLASFIEKRKHFENSLPRPRVVCTTCFQPEVGCYCKSVKSFDPKIEFVILIHPIEVRRRIATGRMSHLCLKNSHLIRGENYSEHAQIDRLIRDPQRHCVMLYPGSSSINLTSLDDPERACLFPEGRILTIFVIDGTWSTARKMVRSSNLQNLSRICFSPATPSRFRVRKQPQEGCYSTIEAIHQTIELLGASQGFAVHERHHDSLLHVFDEMVERQLTFIRERQACRHSHRQGDPRSP